MPRLTSALSGAILHVDWAPEHGTHSTHWRASATADSIVLSSHPQGQAPPQWGAQDSMPSETPQDHSEPYGRDETTYTDDFPF